MRVEYSSIIIISKVVELCNHIRRPDWCVSAKEVRGNNTNTMYVRLTLSGTIRAFPRSRANECCNFTTYCGKRE